MEKEKLNIGNVDFDKDSVLCSRKVYEKGQKFNHVFLVGGTKIMFPDQDGKHSTVSLAMNYNHEVGEVCAWFNNIKGLIIDESPRRSCYFVREM